MSTVIKLLCFSFRLIFATTQPSTQERMRTRTEISSTKSREPMTMDGVRGAVTQ